MRPLLAALAALAFLPVSAHADLTQPAGRPCGSYMPLTDDWTYEDVVVHAGPVSLVDEDTGLPHTGTITCTFRHGYDHTGAEIVSVTSEPGTGVVALPPTEVFAGIEWWEDFSLCTRLDTDSGTLYWYEPWDRNVDPYWSADPTVRCEDLFEPTDLRPQDYPLGPVLSVAQTALGETDPAVAAVDAAVCATEPDPEIYACGVPSQTGALSFVRVPGAAVLRTAAPYGWDCVDRHSGLPVTAGSLLTVPNPGVSCVPDAPVTCGWLELSAYLLPANTGRVTVTEACGDLVLTRVLAPLQGRVAEQWTGMYGTGAPPLRCEADDDTLVEPAYVVACYRF